MRVTSMTPCSTCICGERNFFIQWTVTLRRHSSWTPSVLLCVCVCVLSRMHARAVCVVCARVLQPYSRASSSTVYAQLAARARSLYSHCSPEAAQDLAAFLRTLAVEQLEMKQWRTALQWLQQVRCMTLFLCERVTHLVMFACGLQAYDVESSDALSGLY